MLAIGLNWAGLDPALAQGPRGPRRALGDRAELGGDDTTLIAAIAMEREAEVIHPAHGSEA